MATCSMKKTALIILFLTPLAWAREEPEPPAPPNIGNFALPPSQQPGPLLSFGQNILLKNQTAVYLGADDYTGNQQHYAEALPNIVYGLTDNFSIMLNAPIALSFGQYNRSSSGIEDMIIQGEYYFDSKNTTTSTQQATVVANISLPTGSATKNPPTGSGSTGFFVGTTFNKTYIDWFMYASPGFNYHTQQNGYQAGNNYLYQAAIGRSFYSDPNKWIIAWQVEADGTYSDKNKADYSLDENSGGNVIFLTPSLWASSQHLIAQVGIGYPIVQHWNGDQSNLSFLYIGSIGWTF